MNRIIPFPHIIRKRPNCLLLFEIEQGNSVPCWLATQAAIAFTAGARLSPQYQLLGGVQTSIGSVTPFHVRLTGTWVYTITPQYEQYLAEKIAGETPVQARTSLLNTGVISHVSIPSILPQAMYIKFIVLVEQ